MYLYVCSVVLPGPMPVSISGAAIQGWAEGAKTRRGSAPRVPSSITPAAPFIMGALSICLYIYMKINTRVNPMTPRRHSS